MTKAAEDIVANFDFREPLPAEPLRRRLEGDGVIVVRNLLGAADIERLRGIVKSHLSTYGYPFNLGKTQPNAVAYVSALEFLFADARILHLFDVILGSGNIVFTGHSDIHMNTLSGWHKDSGEAYGGYFAGDYFSANDCRVYKIALYLQDHGNGGGLTVRTASHRSGVEEMAPGVHLCSRAGDAIIFDVRLSHVGQIPDGFEKLLMQTNTLLKGMDRRKSDWKFATLLKAFYWHLRGTKDRMSIFFTFGANNEFTRQFAAANMKRQNAQTGRPNSAISPVLAGALISKGVIPAGHEHELAI